MSLLAGRTYRFNLNGNTLSDPNLSLRSSSGSELASNDDFNGSRNSQITFTAVTAGTYYLDAGGFSDRTGSYTLLAVDISPVDDFANSASTTGSVSIGGSSTGVVESSGDRDWFRVSLLAGRTYRFNLNGNTLSDPTLSLRNSSGDQLSFNDDFNDRNSQITFTATNAGTYYLDAGAFSDRTGSYTLLAVDISPVDDFANSSSTTGSVSIGGSSTGVVDSNGDRDWFAVTLVAGRSYRFNLNGNSLYDPTLYLRNSSGVELAYNDDFNDRNAQIAFTATTAGTYYLDAGAYSTGTGSYTLLAADTSPVDDFAASTSTTGTIAIGGSRTGTVDFNGDRDWFRLTLVAGQTYRFNLNGNTLSDPTLSLRNSSGSELAFNDDFNGTNSQIIFTATNAGTYYLDAGSYSSGTGSYTLLATSSTPTQDTDDFAGSTSTTGTVAIGASSTGVVNSNGDRDWFRVTLAAGRTYRFNLDGNTLGDPTLYLRNSSGDQLSFNDDFNARNSQLTFTAVSAGTYYLDAGAFSNGVGSYTLQATDVTPTPTTDDFTNNSSTTGSLTIGVSASGGINFNGDRDWFRVALQAGRSYSLTVRGVSLSDPDLYLRNTAGVELGYSSDSSGSRNPILTFTPTSTATYFLDVGSTSNVGSGSYTVNVSDVLSGDDFAATTSTTGTVAIGASSSGVVNFNGDRDWFRVTLAANTSYRFNLNANTLTDPSLILRDANGDQLALNNDFSGRSSQIIYRASVAGAYFLDAGSASSNDTGTYTLSAAIAPVSSDDYSADTSTLGLVRIGSQESGMIDFAGDLDWFRVALQAGRSYRFRLNGNTLTDPQLRLRDNSGRTVLASNDNFGSGANSQITFTATVAGIHYLEAAAVGSLTGTYVLEAADVSPTADRITGLVDATIRSTVNSQLSDNLFSQQELASLLRSAGAGGVTSQELADLRTVASQFTPYLSESSRNYLRYIFNAVVNGNAANQWWTQGTSSRVALGNLAAGSVELQMNRLVDKWFLGLDLPSNFAGGDTAANANSLVFSYGRMTGSLFVDDIRFSDVNQGQAGTCYFLAACSTIANSQSQLIRDLFRDNGNGTYGVRFYGSSGSEIWVTVNQSVPIFPDNTLALARNVSRSLSGEMWVALVEKAYAQANEIGDFGRDTAVNGYSAIEGGLEEALRHISGRPTSAYSSQLRQQGYTSAAGNLSTWNSYKSLAISAINSGSSLWLGSFGATFDRSSKRNFVSGHAFAITGYNASTGRFIIANPWGPGSNTYAGVFEASWQEIYNVRGIICWI